MNAPWKMPRLPVAAIIAAYQAPGATLVTVGRAYDCSGGTIAALLRKHGRGDLVDARQGVARSRPRKYLGRTPSQMTGISHIAKMLAGEPTPAPAPPADSKLPDRVDVVPGSAGEAWAVRWRGRTQCMHFGAECEAVAHLHLLRREPIPLALEQQLRLRRDRMAKIFAGTA